MKTAPSPTPSARLRRAADAERRDLGRRREALLDRRRRLRAELEELDDSLAVIDERLVLLDRLTGHDEMALVSAARGSAPAVPRARAGTSGNARVGGHDEAGRHEGPRLDRRDAHPRHADPHPHPADSRAPEGASPEALPGTEHSPRPGPEPLRGPAIRAAAIRVALALPHRPEALHYRDWFRLLLDAGHTVAGKDPLAVFLTQLSRSPLIRRGTQSGVYELDLAAPDRLRQHLEQLHAELHRLTAAAPTADLTSIRSRRTALAHELTKTEKSLEEAAEILDGT